LTTTLDHAVTGLFRDLSAAYSELASLDALAIEQILTKGPNVDHLKGQLLEELVERRVVPWLRTRMGGFALGITVPTCKKLEFIPGHLIRPYVIFYYGIAVLSWGFAVWLGLADTSVRGYAGYAA
jgi:hypothetical protein